MSADSGPRGAARTPQPTPQYGQVVAIGPFSLVKDGFKNGAELKFLFLLL
jgi:hypothetical protein